MYPACTYAGICDALTADFTFASGAAPTSTARLTGILFAPPNSAIGREDIVPRLDDYHHRSAQHVHFFLAGYGAYWPPGWIPDERVVASTTDALIGQKTDWLYSAKHFDDLRREIEGLAPGWRYSGESDLLLTNAVYDAATRRANVDFSTTLVLRLRQLKADGAIDSVPELFERIFAFAEEQDAPNPAWRFSDREGGGVLRTWIGTTLLEKLPLSLGKVWTKGKHYAVHDLSDR